MDTPDRAAAQSAASRTEDSPVFSFLNNLSPIEPLRSSAYSTNSLQGFQSINITSISSIFTSPHDNVGKEPRLPKSPLGEISEKEEVRADAAGTNGPSEPSNAAVTRETRTGTGTGVAGPPTTGGPCDLALPRQFDNNGSPDHNTTPCHGVRSDLKQDKARKLLQAAQNAKNALEKRKCLFSTEVRLLDGGGGGGGGEPGSDSDGVLGCEWSDLVSPTSAKLLAFDPTMDEHHRGVHLAAQNAESCGYLLSKLAGDGGLSDGAYPTASAQVYYQELVMGEDQSENAPQMDAQETISAEEIQDNIYEADVCVPLEYKVVESQQQRGIRRRCLVFEAAGFGFSNNAVKKGTIEDRSVSTCSKGKSPAQSQPRGLRGIGLHLNALALTPKGKMACQDPPPTASALLPSSASEKDARGELLCAGENFAHSGGELLEFPLDDCSAGGFPVNDHHVSGQSVSPQKKRRKTDNGDDGEACKRCSCKKSKCLKLYCECFAAGVYCSEPCSCQGCMNKPIHEETVLSTRKQIEFRNPLAFAPKVIRMSDAGLETGEDPNNTPASARHKRGCNCKKSSCLKKYCECYQGGVGCSSNCRCESCKNAFGRRDAETELPEEMKQEESDQTENPQQEKENDQQKANVQGEDHPLLDLVPITPPFDFCSSLLNLPNFSSAKPPRPTKARSVSSRSSASKATATAQPCRSSKLAASASGIDEETPDILHEPDSLSNCVKTTTSPNGKRVSPPHNALSSSPNRKGGRKLILKSIPLFPSLTGDTNSGSAMNSTDSAFCASPLTLGPS